jgi:hypothetical protein
MAKSKISDLEFIELVNRSTSIAEVLLAQNLTPAGGNYKSFYARIKRLQVSLDHFTGQGHLQGKTHSWNAKIPLSEILVENSNFNTYHLKNRLLKEKILNYRCSQCGIVDWQGKPISLHLDHIDGNNTNHSLSNLRILCPNCHSQTPTYCVKKQMLNI